MHNTAQTTLISNGKNISSLEILAPPRGGRIKSPGGQPPAPRAATSRYSNFYISDSNSVARQEGVGWFNHLCQLVDILVPLSFRN